LRVLSLESRRAGAAFVRIFFAECVFAGDFDVTVLTGVGRRPA
jgi:hypothetical protein